MILGILKNSEIYPKAVLEQQRNWGMEIACKYSPVFSTHTFSLYHIMVKKSYGLKTHLTEFRYYDQRDRLSVFLNLVLLSQ